MDRTRRSLLVLALSLVALTTLPSCPQAFQLPVHEQIVLAALGDANTMSDEALKWVIDANKESDLHQLDPRRHFDNAPGPVDVCTLWELGIKKWFAEAVKLSAPKGDEKRQLANRRDALYDFGRITHAIADFYAHTNWIELAAQQSRPAGQAPLLGTGCDPAAFPDKLQSGYFDPNKGTPTDPKRGCPPYGPPQPFKYCHKDLSKDDPGKANHARAKILAIQATKDAWEALHRRIVTQYEKDRATDAECVFMKLAWGKDRTCHRLWRVAFRAAVVRTDLHLSSGEDVSLVSHYTSERDFVATLRWKPTRYPGPEAPPVFAALEGEWNHTLPMNFRILSQHRWRTQESADFCEGSAPSAKGDVSGELKVVPEQEPVLFWTWWSSSPAPQDVQTSCRDVSGLPGSSALIPSLDFTGMTVADCAGFPRIWLLKGTFELRCHGPYAFDGMVRVQIRVEVQMDVGGP